MAIKNIRPAEQRPEVIRKSADQTVNNSTTLVNDNHLKKSVGANEVWFFKLVVYCNSGATPDLKVVFTIPSGGSGRWYRQQDNSSTTALTTAYTVATAGDTIAVFEGLYIGGGTAGTLQLQWAQNVADPSDSKMLTNSALIMTQLR